MGKPQGKSTLPDDIWARFLAVITPRLKTRGAGSAIAAATGLTPAAISQWKTEKNRPTFHNAVTALRALGFDEEKIATVLGADPRFFAKPQGYRNLAAAFGVPEGLLADLWDNDSIGEEMMRHEEKFQRAARALMHSDGCTLQEALAAIVMAQEAATKNRDSADWSALRWAEFATGFVVKESKSGERPSWPLKKSGGS